MERLGVLGGKSKSNVEILGATLIAWQADSLSQFLFVGSHPVLLHLATSEQQEDPADVVLNSLVDLFTSLDLVRGYSIAFCPQSD